MRDEGAIGDPLEEQRPGRRRAAVLGSSDTLIAPAENDDRLSRDRPGEIEGR